MVKQSEVVKWIENQIGKSNIRGSGNAQCVALINEFYYKFCNGFTRGGYGAILYKDPPYPPNAKAFDPGTPQAGDVLVYRTTGEFAKYGHIGMCLGYNKSTKEITFMDQNYGAGAGYGGKPGEKGVRKIDSPSCKLVKIIRLDMEMDLGGDYVSSGSGGGSGEGGSSRRRRRGSNAGRRFSRADIEKLNVKVDPATPQLEEFSGDPEYNITQTATTVLGNVVGSNARAGTKADIEVAAFGGKGTKILGMPLFFSPLDDPGRRVFNNTFESDLPVVFIQPGKPYVNKKLFGTADEGGWLNLGAKKFNKIGNAGASAIKYLATGRTDFRDNRFQAFKSASAEYYNYVNTLLVQVHTAMALDGVFDLTGFLNNGKYGLAFYASKGTSVSESASNDYSLSEIAREAQDKQAQIREKKLAAQTGGTSIISMVGNWFGELMKSIAEIPVIGGLIGSLTENLDGSGLYYPDKWDDSNFDRSYSLEFRFYSPYGDPSSIFYYVYLPFLCCLCLGLPLQDSYYSYSQPFIVRANAPGYFECEMGIIRSISFERGTDQTWTAEGLPREITIRMTLTDMYPKLMLSQHTNQLKYNYAMVSYIDCLAGVRYDQLTWLQKVQRKLKVTGTRATSVLTLRKPSLWVSDKVNNIKDKTTEHWFR